MSAFVVRSVGLMWLWMSGMSFAALGHAPAEDQSGSLKELSKQSKAATGDEAIGVYQQIAQLQQNEAPSKEVTTALAKGLEHEQHAVRLRVAELMGQGQHPEAAIKQLSGVLHDCAKDLSRNDDRGAQSREFAVQVIRSVAHYRDDRAVDTLSDFFRRNKTSLNGEVSLPLLESLVDLGTADTVQLVISYYETMEGYGRGRFEDLARSFHGVLLRAAENIEVEEVPTFSMQVAGEWRDWFKDHRKAFPTKLGKWKPNTR